MLKRVILAEDPLAPDTWETADVEDVCEFLASRFGKFPDTARIYHGQVSEQNDVTPSCKAEIEALQKLEGTFYVVVYPAGPIAIIAIIALAVVTVIALGQDIPDPPEPMTRKQDNSSPNNELGKRQNRERINGRIPDVFGSPRSTPDLIAPNYTLYENNIETEHSLLCIGKGSFEIPVGEIKEGTTPYSEIENSVIEVYGSGVPPAPYSPREIQIGGALTDAFVATDRSNAVNGQTLIPISGDTLVGSNDMRFMGGWREIGDDLYHVENDGSHDFRNFIVSGATLEITNGDFSLESLDLSQPVLVDTITPFGAPGLFWFGSSILTNILPNSEVVEITDSDFVIDGVTYNLNGVYETILSFGLGYVVSDAEEVNSSWGLLKTNTIGAITIGLRYLTTVETVNVDGAYTVTEVTEDNIYLDNPQLINSDWGKVLLQAPFAPYDKSPTLENLSGNATGPFTIAEPGTSEVIVNFLAPQGLYKDDGTNQTSINIEIETTIQRIDILGAPVGAEEVFNVTLIGSATSRGRRTVTGRFTLSEPSACFVSVSRITGYVSGFTGQISEEVKWVDLYGASSIDGIDFGDVTLVRSKGVATAEATSAKSRSLNMQVTRKIPKRISSSDFTTELFPTSRADEIISFISLDPRIGNRSKDELDFDSIYDTVAEIESYFGSAIATEFNYTFDSDNLSYEEMMLSIAQVIFCTAYRRGSQIKLSFEAETENSTLLFNHRNKLPGSETRTVRFGNRNDNDGVEFDYVDPSDDSIQTFYLPDQNTINPQRIDTPGIRNKLQAHFHAYRIWNKIRYQHIATEFEATQEADLLVLGDRVLNADNTRPFIQDGEVESQLGLELVLSQKVDLTTEPSYIIFLQYPDGTVESIGITAGSDSYRVVLANAPAVGLSLDVDNFARTTYLIVGSTETNLNAFLISEKQPTANFTSTVTAINYDLRYYDNDKDHENGIVDENGNPI